MRGTDIGFSSQARWSFNGSIVAGGHGQGGELNQLSKPWGLYVDNDLTVYVADYSNHRIMAWSVGATSGQLAAGGNGQGNRLDQLGYPTDVIVDRSTDNFIICDRDNRRVVSWPRRGGTQGKILQSNIACWGLTMDHRGFLYVTDTGKQEVRRSKLGDSQGTVVAGGNGQGDRLNQLKFPTYIFVDRDHSVYVADNENHRVMKWVEGAQEGQVVAGGNGQGSSLKQLYYPKGVVTDGLGTVYVADEGNHRVIRWLKGASEGSVVVVRGKLIGPTGLSFDHQERLYVVENNDNYRVQRFEVLSP
ncbi:unnamed protein product [Rotaria sp. Silwood2]|nr:unnamed protein product [Rotaria sp. Silwood2]CAF4401186.1 unnamed protein product [Rotaria sp. Silwood2]